MNRSDNECVLREQTDQVLFFVVLNIKDKIGEVIWKSRAHRERLFRVPNAYASIIWGVRCEVHSVMDILKDRR